MIKMRYEELSKMDFLQAAQKLAQLPLKSPKAFRVKHIVKALEENRKKMSEAFKRDIQDKYATAGGEAPQGESLTLGLPFNALIGLEKECKEELEKFGKREAVIDQPKLDGETIFEMGSWSAMELVALEPIVSDLHEAS